VTDARAGERKLTRRQALFAAEFEAQGRKNAVLAAMKAGYSRKTAKAEAFKLLGKLGIRQRLEERARAREVKLGVATEDNIAYLKRLRDTDLPEIVSWAKDTMTVKDFEKLTPEQKSAIESFEVYDTRWGRRVRIKLKDSIRATELIMRGLGQFAKDSSEKEPPSIQINVIGVVPLPYAKRPTPEEVARFKALEDS
jgi:phage terminase small subunit